MITVVLSIILANIMQTIIWKVLCLMILNLYKMDFKEISIKNIVYNYYFNYFIKLKKNEIKYILIDEKSYKDLVIPFTIYDHGKPIRMLSLYYHGFIAKIEEYGGKAFGS